VAYATEKEEYKYTLSASLALHYKYTLSASLALHSFLIWNARISTKNRQKKPINVFIGKYKIMVFFPSGKITIKNQYILYKDLMMVRI
jgi:hypothetical protein